MFGAAALTARRTRNVSIKALNEITTSTFTKVTRRRWNGSFQCRSPPPYPSPLSSSLTCLGRQPREIGNNFVSNDQRSFHRSIETRKGDEESLILSSSSSSPSTTTAAPSVHKNASSSSNTSGSSQLILAQAASLSPAQILHNLTLPYSPLFSSCYTFSQELVPVLNNESKRATTTLNQRWTCSFKCPVTGMEFSAGNLLEASRAESKGAAAPPVRVGDELFYRRRKQAEKACAGRVLDGYSYWGMWDLLKGEGILGSRDVEASANAALMGMDATRFCTEVPPEPPQNLENLVSNFRLENPLSSSTSPPPTTKARSLSQSQSLSQPIPTATTLTNTQTTIDPPELHPNPIETLNLMYQLYHPPLRPLELLNHSITYETGGENSWTARYTSPITGEVFSSGTLREEEDQVETMVPSKEEDKVWYGDKKRAKKAAVARAVDCFILRGGWKGVGGGRKGAGGVGFWSERLLESEYEGYCIEEPYYYDTTNDETVQVVKKSTTRSHGATIVPESTMVRTHISPTGTKQQLPTPPKPKSALDTLHRIYNPTVFSSSQNQTSTIHETTQLVKDDNYHKAYWTSSFKSPVTGEVFKAGTLRADMDIGLPSEFRTVLGEDGEVYYSKKKWGIAASIAKAVDCFALRGGWTSSSGETNSNLYRFPEGTFDDMGHVGYCVEPPYHSVAEKEDLPYLIPEMESTEDVGSDDGALSTKESLKKPRVKQLLSHRYQSILSRPLPLDSYQTTFVEIDRDGTVVSAVAVSDAGDDSRDAVEKGDEDDEDKENNEMTSRYWTSSFKCPITRQIFPSGTLFRYGESSSSLLDEAKNLAPIRTIDGRIYYLDRDEAEQAAAGRASDYLTGGNIWSFVGGGMGQKEKDWSAPRFCVEDWRSSNNTDERGVGGTDEYVVLDVPGAWSTDGTHTTMDVLLESWAESSSVTSCSGNDILGVLSKPSLQDKERRTLHPFLLRRDAIATAIAFYNRMEPDQAIVLPGVIKDSLSSSSNEKKHWKRPRQKLSSGHKEPVTINSYNAVLCALGNTNTIEAARATTDDVDVEDLADKLLISAMKSSTPTVETFNHYLSCFSPWFPGKSARKAHALLHQMARKDGEWKRHKNLPSPNVHTLNAVLNFWGKVRGRSYTRALELFEEWKKMDFEKGTGSKTITSEECLPDRETYFAILSSLAYEGPGWEEPTKGKERIFHETEAQQWIDRLRSYRDYDGNSFPVDAAIYDAPLPHPGVLSFSAIYRNGFHPPKNDDHPSVVDALAIERWTIDRENNDDVPSPTLRTYEAVIHAWIRTGTMEGLHRAEAWALRCIDNADAPLNALPYGILSEDFTVVGSEGVKPRRETFLPIINAWARCGDVDGPQNVQEWIDRLERLEDESGMSWLRVDRGRLRGAVILAWRNLSQKRKTRRGSDELADEEEETTTSYLSIAEKCSECLEIICEDFPDDFQTGGNSADSNRSALSYESDCYVTDILCKRMFQNVVEAWKDVAKCTNMPENEKDQDAYLAEMLKVVRLMDDRINALRRTDNSNNGDDDDDEGADNENDDNHDIDDNQEEILLSTARRRRLQSLMRESRELHESVITHVGSIETNLDGARDDSNGIPFVEQNFHHVEGMLRRSEEYLASGIFRGKEVARWRVRMNLNLYKEVFRCCKLLTSRSRYGDGVRVVSYVLDRLPSNPSDEPDDEITGLYLSAVDVLSTIVPKDEEKALLFYSLWRDSKERDSVDTKKVIDKMTKILPSFMKLKLSFSNSDVSGGSDKDEEDYGSNGTRRRLTHRGRSIVGRRSAGGVDNSSDKGGGEERLRRRRRYIK